MPSRADVTISVLSVELDGSPMSPQLSRSLFEVEVENSLYLPASFTIRFQLNSVEGDEFDLIDNDFRNALSDGMKVKILDKDTGKVLLEGTATSVSLEFSAIVPSGPIYAVVQGYDNSHKLHRGRQTRTFLKQKSSDIVSTLAGEVGLSASVDATSTKHEYIIQSNQTNWELIWQLASRVGYEVYVEGSSLNFKKPREQRSTVDLTWGVDLQQFRTRASTSFQWAKATVRGWDQMKKEVIEGESNSGEGTTKLKDSRKGIDQAKSAFGNAELIVADVPVQDSAEAKTMAQSLIDSLAGEFMEAEGVTSWGMAEILPGVRVNVKGMGRHSGQYYVTSSTHRYSPMEGYTTTFAVGGRRPNTLMDYMGGNNGSPALDKIQGVVTGVVTNNNDPDDVSRVKVKFPWLGQDIESNWARIAFPGAGPSRGMNWLPEVNDEVLVAFEHGDIHRPYVLGGLWNQKDKAPDSNSSIVKDKKVNLRSLTSREGLGLIISDESGKRSITMSNPDDGSKVSILHDDKVIEILSNGDIKITGKKGKITIEGKDIEIKSSTNLKLEAKANVEIKAGANLKIDAKANLNMKGGVQAALQGTMTSVKGSAMTEVKGGLVKIN